MGEVYRARDSRLGREVALKVLPEHLARDPLRLQRFEQEARSASALNHPNIVTIYELGQVESTYYIAMELVEGDTLRDLLSAGQVPLHKGIEIAVQVAEGLAQAHEIGIVHRDLKPENLMVSRDGRVKILDFGLAKLTSLSSDASETVTLGGARTVAGALLGTVGYMSPEQASGQPWISAPTNSPSGWCSMRQPQGSPHFYGERLPKRWLRFFGMTQSRFRRLIARPLRRCAG